jgi:hypothetical protein
MQEPRKYPRSRPTFAGALLSAVAFCGGCSLLLHADATQCSSTSECTARGPAFANHVCMSGSCVSQAITSGDGGDGGGADAHMDAPAEALADVSNVGDAIDATPVDAGCRTNADCPMSSQHPEVACDVASGACLQLTTDECPFVIGDYSGRLNPPVFVGAFATIPPVGPLTHPSYENYLLAINEFDSAGGITGWNPVTQRVGLRMPAAVICNVAADVGTAMNHLISDVHVPAVVAALDSVTLRTTFENIALPNNIFVINPFGANTTLTSLTTNGLLWHMLGQPSDYAPAYQALFPRIEAYVRSAAEQNIPAGTALRVATVTANATDTQDLAGAVEALLTWNGGKTVTQNTQATPPAFLNVAIDSVLNGTDLATIDVTAAVTALDAFKPNVVISFASAEFVKLLQTYEVLHVGQPPYSMNPPPFYVIGPYNMESTTLKMWIGNGAAGTPSETRRTRIAGIGVASASDTHALDAYETRFVSVPNNPSGLGQENYYDAMYFAVYSVLGAGPLPTLSGTNVAQGMLRLLSGSSYDVGPQAIGNVCGALGAPTGSIQLFGALGPPDFTIRTGARVGEGDVYCIQRNTDLTPAYLYDVLRVAPSSDGGVPGLGGGTFSCYSGL